MKNDVSINLLVNIHSYRGYKFSSIIIITQRCFSMIFYQFEGFFVPYSFDGSFDFIQSL